MGQYQALQHGACLHANTEGLSISHLSLHLVFSMEISCLLSTRSLIWGCKYIRNNSLASSPQRPIPLPGLSASGCFPPIPLPLWIFSAEKFLRGNPLLNLSASISVGFLFVFLFQAVAVIITYPSSPWLLYLITCCNKLTPTVALFRTFRGLSLSNKSPTHLLSPPSTGVTSNNVKPFQEVVLQWSDSYLCSKYRIRAIWGWLHYSAPYQAVADSSS